MITSDSGEGRCLIEFQFYMMKKFWRSVSQQCKYTLLDCAFKNGLDVVVKSTVFKEKPQGNP